jgi:fimbrial chaperone protein
MPGLRLLAAALLLLLPSASIAASFTVVPTRIVLEGDHRSGSLTVRNEGPEPVLVQVDSLRWTQAVPTIRTEPTRDLLAVPPVFRLQPGGEQTVRVGLRGPAPAGPETTYRLLLSEVPTAEDARPGGVQFALRLSIPVFVRPPGAEARLVARIERSARGWALVVHNAGDAHARLEGVHARRRGGSSLPVAGDPGYLLPGESRRFPIGGPDLAAGETVVVEIENQGGSRSFELVVGDG